MTQPDTIYVIVEDRGGTQPGGEGYGWPIKAYQTKTEADTRVKTMNAPHGYDYYLAIAVALFDDPLFS